jgi:diguanylate cyclase (GGDEF)-like protein/PAS domain S-box-containing protein
VTGQDSTRPHDGEQAPASEPDAATLARLVANDERFRVVLSEAPFGVVVLGADVRVQIANGVVESIMGYGPGDMDLRPLGDFCPADRWPVLHQLLRDGVPGETFRSVRVTLLHRDGHEVPVQGSATVLGDRGGPVRGFLVILRDITHEQEAELRARARFEKLVNFSADIVTVFGADRRLKYTSPQGQRVLGWQEDDLPAGILSALHPDDLPAAESALDELFAGTWGPDRPLTFRIRSADGGWHHFESRGVDLSNDPDIAGVVITSRDVTERERLASQLAHAARHDHLTGLANRASFAEQLEQAMARVDRAGTSLGTCYLDLDHFKPVNDTHGHAVGDEVLVSVADRLRQTCRQGDVAARLGGDEFVVIIEHVIDDKEVEAFTDRLGKILAAPHATSVGAIRCPATIGWARSEPGEPSGLLLRRADDHLLRRKAARPAR